MGKIFETKTDIATQEFTPDYDKVKDKYYLSVVAFGEWITETFFGDWALAEYLRDEWNFTESQIEDLKASAY